MILLFGGKVVDEICMIEHMYHRIGHYTLLPLSLQALQFEGECGCASYVPAVWLHGSGCIRSSRRAAYNTHVESCPNTIDTT